MPIKSSSCQRVKTINSPEKLCIRVFTTEVYHSQQFSRTTGELASIASLYNEDANSLIKRIEGDILYLDPPYNSRQYSANYHLLNTIADYKSFTPKGKTELREYNKSNYCSKAKVQHTFKDLIRNARFRYIVLSYNNEGIMPMQTIEQIMTKYGNYQMFQKEHQRFKADKTENKNHLADTTTEYLQAKQNPQ